MARVASSGSGDFKLSLLRRGSSHEKAQLFLGLGQGGVKALLARRRALQEEAKRDCCLAGSGISFEQKYVPYSQATPQNIVTSSDADPGFV
jgi:hypothetical protein